MENKIIEKIRSPIITVAGHVDHGKTSILDSIRKTEVTETEAGGITQKISFTKVPISHIENRYYLKDKGIKLDFPGFLFIDTPGHAAFSHIRKRGGSLADLAILVMDINEGLMPQTIEVLGILRLNKVPFVIALNKIDNISGWRKYLDNIKENIDAQNTNTKTQFEEKIYTVIGALYHHGFIAKPFYEIKDFSKELALVPCSAKTGEGIKELILTVSGLSQKFLKVQLKIGNISRGVILEIKKEKALEYCEAIIYDGELNIKDEIAIASLDEPIITKIRVLEEIEPVSSKFKPVKQVIASSGIRMQIIDSKNVLPGMPFIVIKNNIEEIKREFKKELNKITTDKQGIIVKADSLGSLEALLTLLKQERIQVISAGIGKINKKDVIQAKANVEINRINAVILGFNVDKDEEIKDDKDVAIITHDIIYKLIEDVKKFKEEKQKEIKRERLLELATISKLKIFHQYVFRNSNPAVFGVKVEAGKIKIGIPLITEDGKNIGKIKDIQAEKTHIDQADEGKEIAISIPGTNFERQLQDINYLYSDLTEKQFKKFKDNKDLLSDRELQTLQKIADIKRKTVSNWGY